MFGKKKQPVTDDPRRLNTIVEGTVIKGSMTTESNIRIDGTIDGDVKSLGKVVLGKTGKIIGDLNCMKAELDGQLLGNIEVENLLIIRKSAVLTGNIKTELISIEEGAKFTGQCIVTGTAIKKNNKIQENIFSEQENTEDLVY